MTTTLLLLLVGVGHLIATEQTRDTTRRLLRKVAALHEWPSDSVCNHSMGVYVTRLWSDLTAAEQDEALFCIARNIWSQGGNSLCDVLMREFDDWSELDQITKHAVNECVYGRLAAEAIRSSLNRSWVPTDVLTNPFRKYELLYAVAHSALISIQFMVDHTVSLETLQSRDYHTMWHGLGLATSHYTKLAVAERPKELLSNFSRANYFAWNNLTYSQMANDVERMLVAVIDAVIREAIPVSQALTPDNDIAAMWQALAAQSERRRTTPSPT